MNSEFSSRFGSVVLLILGCAGCTGTGLSTTQGSPTSAVPQPGQSQIATPSKPGSTPTPPATAPAPSPVLLSGRGYPEELVKNFMASCTAAGVTPTACGCTILQVQQTYSYPEFQEINQKIGLGQDPPQSFQKLVETCKRA